MASGGAKKQTLTYEAPWPIYGLDWSDRPDKPFRLALGSFIEEYANKVDIVQLNPATDTLERVVGFDHPYPTTKISWIPDRTGSRPDLLATTGDYLRLWEVSKEGETDKSVGLKCLLNNNKNSEYCAPLTSFDWCESDPETIGTSSIDTTCTIWDVEKQTVKTQLIAHDKEVYDIAFSRNSNVFSSVGADGSMRMFDLRTLEHSTIIYESPNLVPLLRVCWNKQNENYLATFAMDSHELLLLVFDTRNPTMPAAALGKHEAPVNSICWAPHTADHLCSAGDDAHAFIWDVKQRLDEDRKCPILAYRAPAQINQLSWSRLQPEWISICFEKTLQALKV